MLFLIGDTETAGLGAEKKPVEIALRLIDNGMNTVQEWQSLVDPEIRINPDAMAIHGITDEMVRTAPTSAEFVNHVIGGQLEGDICLIGHNVDFDKDMIDIVGNITATICTLDMARTLLPRPGPVNYKLQTLREYLHIPESEAHRAMGDVNTTHYLLKILVEISGRPLEAHAQTGMRVIHTMPFGKYAGLPLFELPRGYTSWLLSLPDLNANLRHSLLAMKEIQ